MRRLLRGVYSYSHMPVSSLDRPSISTVLIIRKKERMRGMYTTGSGCIVIVMGLYIASNAIYALVLYQIRYLQNNSRPVSVE